MKVKFLFAILSCLLLNVSPQSNNVSFNHVHKTQNDTETRVVGYLPNWSYQAYENIDFSALTHLNIAFCNIDSNGEFTSGIPDNDMRDLVFKAHEYDVKVMAALGGGGYCDAYRDLISSNSKIISLNNKIANFCLEYNLDGIDLDIELGSGDAVWQHYDEWVLDLRSICDSNGWLLSTATAQWVAYDVTEETFSLFDYINVMAYDDDTSPVSHSSYDFAIHCLDYFHEEKNIPKEKLVLGVPFYGRGYNNDGSLNWNSYTSFNDLIRQDEANYNRDEYNGIAYNGASTIREKCLLSLEYGGIMIWEITLDADEEYSLLSIIKEELISSQNINPINPDNPDLDPNKTPKNEYLIPIISSSIILLIILISIIVRCIKKKQKKYKITSL